MIQKIITIIVIICMILCFDSIMNHVLKDVGLFWKITTGIGRFAIGWFSFKPLYHYILNRLNEDYNDN